VTALVVRARGRAGVYHVMSGHAMELLITAVLLPVAYVAYRVWVVPYRRRASLRALRQMSETPIAGVKNGANVRIRGRAVARSASRSSPISRRACIGFRVIIESHRIGSEDDWHHVIEREEFGPFVLRDDTGDAVLHGPFDIVLDPYDARTENHPPELFDFLEREGEVVRGRRFRYVETILMAGDEITAAGLATIEPDPAGYAPSPRHLPVMCHFRGLEDAVVIADADDLAPA
jgi:hypothetical protein